MKNLNVIKKITTIGSFIGLALIFSYVEALMPLNLGMIGIKIGLANIVVVTSLYYLNIKETFAISVIRILIAGLLFGNGVSIIYSLTGGLLSLIAMIFAKKLRLFSVVGVSIIGGVFHNIGQIIAAAIVMDTFVVAYYLPILMIVGSLTGCLLGFISAKILMILKKQLTFSFDS